MKKEISGNHHRTRLPVKFIPAEPAHLYTYPGEAGDIDRGIRDTIKNIRLSILAMGMGLAKMRAKNLFRDLGFQSMTQYIQRLCDETKMDQRSVFNWLYIGEAYIKYQNDLEQIGFDDSDGPTKLPFLEQALEKNEKHDVFDNIKNMTVRDFITFSKGGSDVKPFITVREGSIYINGVLAVKINKRLDKSTFTYFGKVNRIAGKTIEEGGILYPVRLRDRDELRRYQNASRYLLEKIRKNTHSTR